MIFDYILSLTYGFFSFVMNMLPIPAKPDWYNTDVFPVMVNYIGAGTKLISFVFPSSLWSFLVDFTKDCLLCRLIYDIYIHFTPLKRAAST